MPLSLKQIEYICLHENTDGKKCRYLARDSNKYMNWICLKKTSKRPFIDREIDNYKLTMKNYMTEEMPPFGDNCEGFPIMKHLTQGI